MSIVEEKKALRSFMFKKRGELDALTKKSFDQFICNALESLVLNQSIKTVHTYIPFLTEIDIKPLIEKLLALNIAVVCPKTLPKRQLENRILTSLQNIEVGIKGTLHPKDPEIYTGSYDLIIVPGLAFDKNYYRLGYGGGYYDNFLLNQPNTLKVGIFYPFQEVEKVPMENHDVKLDRILTAKF